jgi:hypothetical protein
MDLESLYHGQIDAMADDIKAHVKNGDLHRAALVAASMSSTLATMLTIVRFEQGVADERAKRAVLDAAEREGRESAAEMIRRMDGVQ